MRLPANYHRVRWALAIVVASALTVIVGVLFIYYVSFSHCIATWANLYTQRTEQTQQANIARTAALDALVRSVAVIRTDPDLFERDLAAYIAASDAYTIILQKHPIPPPPAETC